MDLTTAPNNLLPELLSNWRKEYPKRAAGGWWALSGFALQTSIYLLRFFQKVEKGADLYPFPVQVCAERPLARRSFVPRSYFFENLHQSQRKSRDTGRHLTAGEI